MRSYPSSSQNKTVGWRYSGLGGLRVAPRVLRTRYFSASMLHTLQHVGLWSRASHVRTKRRLLAVGSAPTAQMATCRCTCGQHSSTQTGPVGGVWAALKDCLAFGTYFSAGVTLTEPTKAPEPTGRAACCPLCD